MLAVWCCFLLLAVLRHRKARCWLGWVQHEAQHYAAVASPAWTHTSPQPPRYMGSTPRFSCLAYIGLDTDALLAACLPAGTPSLLSLPLLEQLLQALDRRFGLAAGAEVRSWWWMCC